jgi:hypothetical protein
MPLSHLDSVQGRVPGLAVIYVTVSQHWLVQHRRRISNVLGQKHSSATTYLWLLMFGMSSLQVKAHTM